MAFFLDLLSLVNTLFKKHLVFIIKNINLKKSLIFSYLYKLN
jgi:hypothetical protein